MLADGESLQHQVAPFGSSRKESGGDASSQEQQRSSPEAEDSAQVAENGGAEVGMRGTHSPSSSLLQFLPPPATTMAAISAATTLIPPPSFAQFSAANLFGLFEKLANGQFVPEPKVDISPNGTNKIVNKNNNAKAVVKQQQQPPIDKLLQISQQFLNPVNSDATASNNQQQLNSMTNKHQRGTGTMSRKSRGTPPEGGGKSGENGTTVNERKRSYPYTFQFCVLCQKNVHSSKLPCHIRQCHVGKPMFQCPTCDFTSTYSKNNVKSHMVSLHGLAGDPISYMDQYAAQVEEFMKQCFPNVRGRGRPLHGRFSPAGSSPSKLSSVVGSSPTRSMASTVCDQQMTPPQQQRRHSSVVATLSHHQQQRGSISGRQKTAQQKSSPLFENGGTGPAAGGVLSFANGADWAAQQPTREFSALLEKGLVPFQHNNGFVPPPFNPFIYLQQLNGLYALGGSPPFGAHSSREEPNATRDTGNSNDFFLPKVNMEVDTFEQQQTTTTSALFSLEECLSLSQKFLMEINKNDKNAEACSSNLGHNEAAKDALACHSSSSTASPPSSAVSCFPAASSTFASSSSELQHENGTSSAEKDAHSPRYFPQKMRWQVLDGAALERTVFKTFADSAELIEKMDLSVFESLLEQQASQLLTDAQRQQVASVRRQLGSLKSFEIMFAVHRLDTDVLKPDQVKLVAGIAPTQLDMRRFALYEGALDEDEQFVVQLAKVDRLHEKLAVMSLMGDFDERIAQFNQHLLSHSMAAKLLYNSAEFHTLLHLLLTCANLINGDFSMQLVKGFRPSCIPRMCTFRFPNGASLLEIVAGIVRRHFFAELATFAARCRETVQQAAKVDFACFHRELRSLEHGQQLVEEELQACEGKNTQLANFLTHCELECAQLRESVQSTKSQLMSMLEFFGECSAENEQQEDGDIGQCQTNQFFAAIVQFTQDLETALAQ